MIDKVWERDCEVEMTNTGLIQKITRILFNLLNMTLGKIIRLHERMKYLPETINFIDKYHTKSILDSVDYAYEFFNEAVYRSKREEVWDYCINLSKTLSENLLKTEPVVLEFGVWKGYSTKYFAEKYQEAQIYGFDSFVGLFEEWKGVIINNGDRSNNSTYPTGSFSTNSKLPAMPPNVRLIEGYFHLTVPEFKLNKPISIMHIDCDTYESSYYVLTQFANNLVPGSIIIFDEYYGFTNWRAHEHKALMDFSRISKKQFKYIAYTSIHVAIQLI